MVYDNLLIESEDAGLVVKEKRLYNNDGLISGERIAIRNTIPTTAQKCCVLAEELGHHYTTAGNILDQTATINRKQEYKARLWAYDKLIGLQGLIHAYAHGCKTWNETADFLEVSEEFLREAVDCYRSKYGVYVEIDNYLVYFIPVYNVLKIID
ncbi:ImmA/IrrE family metallo-endopeptidase [Ruminococcus sp. OA3]|uniref:ImmA/IrrE family metallo-endopeptidase n=1 Tax=Ruminococcus sp. OA3 TaxID=2914164 RepID=UPI001F06011F|nr:ImmA/IrrE family metallo-endopeptidase [Ruminococcus sp. OA3]MCH1982457.1 ImmA/IrrE family metallo-endopeptidase [Ruminococcus sp. OA3]